MYEGNNIHYNSLEIGTEFQDFIVKDISKKFGLSISIYQSKKYQYKSGESVQGIEIKYDARSTGDCMYKECKPTNNIGIEVAEKTNKNNNEFVASGIYREDNTWLYIIGNYHQYWIFSKTILKLLHSSNRYKTVETLPTIKTMLLPIPDGNKYCAKKVMCR